MNEPFALVVNPSAGAGEAARLLPLLRRAFDAAGASVQVLQTKAPRDATAIVRRVLRAGEHQGVAVVGGDGTLSEAVNGFFDEDGAPIHGGAWLAPLPCGTGGDFRRTLGIPKAADKMVRWFLDARARPVDVGWLEFVDDAGQPDQRAFINIASFGLGGIVDRKVNDTPKWMGGTPAFLLGTLRAMVGYANQRVRVTVDDQPPRELAVLNLAVANGRYFGGGMHVAPRAKIDDGLFDVVAIQLDRLGAVRMTPALYRGTHLSNEGVWHTRGARVYAEPVDPSERVLLDVDGEAPGALPATFRILPGALQLRG